MRALVKGGSPTGEHAERQWDVVDTGSVKVHVPSDRIYENDTPVIKLRKVAGEKHLVVSNEAGKRTAEGE